MEEDKLVTLQELQYAIKNVGSFDFGDFSFDTIQQILDMYSQLEKENESLVAQYEYQGAIMVNEYMPLETIKELFIPKSVIREKIEEYEWAIKSYDCDIADYKQSQDVGSYMALVKLLGGSNE